MALLYQLRLSRRSPSPRGINRSAIWDRSTRPYAIALYDEAKTDLQPLTDEEAALLLNLDPAIAREWSKWNAMTGNKGSLVVLDVERARRVLASATDEDEIEGLA